MRHDFATLIDEPELIAICQSCKHPDCNGMCKEYSKKWQELNKTREYVVPQKHGTYKAFGEEHTISEWASIIGVSYMALYKRVISRHQPIEKALMAYKQGGKE